MDLVLIMHGQAMAKILGVITTPLTTGPAKTAGRGTQVRTGTAKILIQIVGQIIEQGLKVRGGGAKQNQIAGGTVHVGHTGTVFLPKVADVAQFRAAVKHTGRLVQTYGMEMGHTRKLIRHIRVTANNTTAVTENTNDTTVFPMSNLVPVGQLKLTQNVKTLGLFLCLTFQVSDETRPWATFEFV